MAEALHQGSGELGDIIPLLSYELEAKSPESSAMAPFGNLMTITIAGGGMVSGSLGRLVAEGGALPTVELLLQEGVSDSATPRFQHRIFFTDVCVEGLVARDRFGESLTESWLLSYRQAHCS